MYDVKITVKSVKGECSAGYKVGDYFYLKDPNLFAGKPEGICIYALGALIPYLTAFCRETERGDWINNVKELQCADNLNSVTFEITREKGKL
jgi:uncharacterized repeat protein (TIGR04076 family)